MNQVQIRENTGERTEPANNQQKKANENKICKKKKKK